MTYVNSSSVLSQMEQTIFLFNNFPLLLLLNPSIVLVKQRPLFVWESRLYVKPISYHLRIREMTEVSKKINFFIHEIFQEL